jgi:hypothetical protein
MRLVGFLIVLIFSGSLFAEEIPQDWAFSSMKKPTIPKWDSSKPIQNPIDVFLLQKLQAKGLDFSPPASREVLLRRIMLDLTGLPPTPSEVDAFLNDSSDNAYDRLVEKLLVSPRYGERAALFWLDLVRFAESDGFKSDDKRPHAWRYRDYVIDSFNNDKPFDRFIQEQLAGDELFPNDFNAWIATGFLRHYPDEYNAVNLEQRRQEILNDITDTTGQVFLGLTLSCAKCHDHKYDPIRQRDYYRIQAFFVGWKPVELPLLSKSELEAYEAKVKAWEEKTVKVRAEMDKLEKPYREKTAAKQRSRFPEEYACLLDIPEEKRSPVQRQIAMMIEKQVYPSGSVASGMNKADKAKWDDLKQQLDSFGPKPKDPPIASAMTDVGVEVPTTQLLKRGNWRNPIRKMNPGFLSEITEDDPAIQIPNPSKTSGRRTVIAKWITDPENPLTARVFVNRIWQQHFGRGLVGSSSDFGAQGDRPSHPELLDWLAREFIQRKWSIKELHRMIVTSKAYQQTSIVDPEKAKEDPENLLLSRMNRRRLDGEAIRDSILSVTGKLNLKMSGVSIQPELPPEIKPVGWTITPDERERDRRSIYVYVKRNLRYPIFAAFDSPDRNETCSRRFETITAPQAMMLLNDRLVLSQSKTFASNLLKQTKNDLDAVIEQGFRSAIGRLPNSEERAVSKEFLDQQLKKGTREEAVTSFCHALFNLNEFIFID